MASSQGCSLCSKSWDKGSSRSSHAGGWREGGIIPTYYYGDIAVTKFVRTTKNAGRNFWGCPHYKDGSSIGSSNNFFKWCFEENIDEKDCTNVRKISFKVILMKEVKKDRDGIRKELKKCKRREAASTAQRHFTAERHLRTPVGSAEG
ncbi:hypothetical protein LR48_Vigan226s000800 [Vigna angularis]|uniref:GRF-type domain-containing protein n=1 Tax=Phaseolus angularis TaxID=3914 RepID=A0A0L9T7J8_PHAAN|nr:hypothetical protein LR48_Vigan226s000800 [Vigna angularis]